MGLMMDEPNAKEAQSKVGYKIVDRNGAAGSWNCREKFILHKKFQQKF